MFLSTSRKAPSCLLAVCVLFAATPAAADAKQCVQQNNDGADLRDQHHLLAAREAYRACVAEPECPAIIQSECDGALTDLKTAVPTLLVSVVDEQGHDIPGATLTADAKSVALDGSALEVDPGVHELEATSGALSSRLQVMAIEGDVNRRIPITLQAPKPAPVAPPPVLLAPQRSKVPAYLLGGVAALGAASFAYFALSGHADRSDLDACKPYCTADQVNQVRHEYLLADVSLGVSLVALAGAGYWLFSTHHAEHAEPRATAKRLSLTAIAGPGAAGLSVRWVE